LQTNEAAKLRREILKRVGNGLGIYYGDVLKEAIPDQFTELLRGLVATTEAERGRIEQTVSHIEEQSHGCRWFTLTEGSAGRTLHIAHDAS